MTRWITYVFIVLFLAVPVAGASSAPVERSNESTSFDSLRVNVQPDGTARVTAMTAYNLANSAENRTFTRLEANESAQRDAVDRFRTQLRGYIDSAANLTDREMAVENASISLRRTGNGSTGIVAYRATWVNLSSSDVARIRLPPTEQFDPVKELIIERPSTHQFWAVEPAPDGVGEDSLSRSQTVTFAELHRTRQMNVSFRSSSTVTENTSSTRTPKNSQPTDDAGSGFGAIQVVYALGALVGLGTSRLR